MRHAPATTKSAKILIQQSLIRVHIAPYRAKPRTARAEAEAEACMKKVRGVWGEEEQRSRGEWVATTCG